MSKLVDNINVRNISKIQEDEVLISFNYNDEEINFNGKVTYEGDIDTVNLLTAKPIILNKLKTILEEN